MTLGGGNLIASWETGTSEGAMVLNKSKAKCHKFMPDDLSICGMELTNFAGSQKSFTYHLLLVLVSAH